MKNTKHQEKKIKRTTNKKQNKVKEKKQRNNSFSFEDEIVIGVTKREEKTTDIKKIKERKEQKSNKRNNYKNEKKEKFSKVSQEEKEKKKKKIFNIIKYGVLSILVITVILCAMYSPLFNIKEIKVEGNNTVTKNEIISLSQIQIEKNIFEINKNKIREQIKENPYIEDVNTIRKLPSTIVLKVQEREPAYLLEYAASYIYLDKQGYILEINTEKLELPILQGAVTETSEFTVGNRLCKEDLEKLSMVLKVIELANTNEIYNLITRIDIEKKENLKLIFETKKKVAYLGDNTNLNAKVLSIKAILEKTEGKEGEIFVNMDLNNENPMFREKV